MYIRRLITKNGYWLCNVDKELYKRKIESGGRVEYTTVKVNSISTIHPSKRPKRLYSDIQMIRKRNMQ